MFLLKEKSWCLEQIAFITEDKFLQYMNITIIYTLIIQIKWKTMNKKIIKALAKLSVAHWLKDLVCAN